MRRGFACRVGLFAMLLLLPALAFAQSGSSIAGVVKDSSGAVLPGVTVEAASPALIEKVRTVVTDGEGQYKIVGLVPGTYSVTFTLTGFNTIKREGVELTASFTATVNAELRVGSLTETVTVTGAAPTVDIQNVVQQRVMTRDVINAIPAGTKSVASIGVLIPGVVTQTQDVGGTAFSATAIAIHGSRFNEQQLLYDGVYLQPRRGIRRQLQHHRAQRRDGAGSQPRGRQHVGREPERRAAHQHHPARRRQHVQGLLLRLFHGQQAAGRQPGRFAEGARPGLGAAGDENLRHRSRVRRAAAEGQGLVLRLVSQAELAADRRRPLLQPHAGDAGLLAGFRQPGAEQRRERQPEPARDVADQPEEQDEPAGPERPAEAAVLRLRLLQRVHDLAGSDLLFRVAADVPRAIELELAGHLAACCSKHRPAAPARISRPISSRA